MKNLHFLSLLSLFILGSLPSELIGQLQTIDGTGIDNNGVTAVVRIISGNGAQNLLLDGNEIDATADGLFLNNNTDENVVLVNGGGRVGVGTVFPAEKLHVEGDALFVPEDTDNSGVDLSLLVTRETDNDDPEFPDFVLKVLPQGNFQVVSNKAFLGDSDNRWNNVYTQNIDMGPSLGGRKLKLYSSGSSSYGMGVTAGHFKFHIGNPQAKFAFYDTPTENNEIFTINGNGTFGFNEPNPTHTLSVNGNVSKPGGGSWIVSSDKRLKTNIQKFKLGLDIIKEVNPRTFQYNGKLNLPTDQKYIGVVAQELKKIAPFMVSEFEKEGETYLAVDPSAFDYILINAVKEMNETLEEKEAQISDLKLANTALEARLTKIEALLFNPQDQKTTTSKTETTTLTNAKLFTNQPNPFSKTTTIRYFIPETVKQAALHITSATGEVLKAIQIAARGEGQQVLEAQALSAGTYFYSLVLDGQILETKQMVLTK